MNLIDALSSGSTGPVIRSVGIKKDMRFLKSETYSHYWFLSFQSYLGKRGDSYDRFLIRVREMYESVSIIFQVLNNLSNQNNTNINSNNPKNYNFNSFYDFLITKRIALKIKRDPSIKLNEIFS